MNSCDAVVRDSRSFFSRRPLLQPPARHQSSLSSSNGVTHALLSGSGILGDNPMCDRATNPVHQGSGETGRAGGLCTTDRPACREGAKFDGRSNFTAHSLDYFSGAENLCGSRRRDHRARGGGRGDQQIEPRNDERLGWRVEDTGQQLHQNERDDNPDGRSDRRAANSTISASDQMNTPSCLGLAPIATRMAKVHLRSAFMSCRRRHWRAVPRCDSTRASGRGVHRRGGG
jgi:hypothetical protein